MKPHLAFSINFVPHAVERYRDRLKPGLTVEEAGMDLERIATHAHLAWNPPGWFGGSSRNDVTMFLLIGDDAVFPLTPSSDGKSLVALTCRVRGSFSPHVRAIRNLRRKQRKARTGRVTGPVQAVY